MASRGSHLDATQGREVVYCHGCTSEWYKDEHPGSMTCPRCHGDIVEIVDPNNDPRGMNDPEELFGFGHHRPYQHPRFDDSDSDPEEADIDEFHTQQGPRGFFARRSIHHSPEGLGPGRRGPANPGNSEDIIRRFTQMLGEMGGPAPMMVGRSGPETLFPDGDGSPRVTYRRITGPGFSGGVSSFTITAAGSGPARTRQVGGQAGGLGETEAEDPFQRIFADIFRVVGPPPLHRDEQDEPHPHSPNRGNGGIGGGRPGDLTSALNQLFASVLNPNAVHGDAVHSQEALDRIITHLMETNPQSNAPAPASEDAIAKLERKSLDEAMLGPELKGECTICIDDMKLGDEVIVLPCKHWFHEECVVLWLKEHNSCPVCRAPIDGNAAGQPGAASASNASNSQQPPAAAASSSFSRPGVAERRRSNIHQRGDARLESIRELGTPYERRQTSRRDSNSPPLHYGSAQYSPRVRSPSPSSRRSSQSERARDNRGSGGTGPLNWLRDQFTRERRF
ncbi:hypothetical protein F5X96DRAFT_168119 [Biscogniauxia mediterranea]|nr:hypothetical protein F5X96DRAFT_168119 [Biscogniauxia mediterranea]